MTDNTLLSKIIEKVTDWKSANYPGIEKESLNILNHIKKVGFLYSPQIEALETYIYLKEVQGNKTIVEVVKSLFDDERELIKVLGISDKEAFELAFDKDKSSKISKLVHDKFNGIDYSNQIYALTMGSGKTILMGTMMMYDFVLSYYHQDDKRFGKNALVFAPDTTIIESLKEIKAFDYSKVLPSEYQNIALNVKYHYLESPETPVNPIGNYNVVVSNSQKIILKTRHKYDGQQRLFRDESFLKARAVENKRLMAIRDLSDLIVFVDEAHHSFGTTLEGTLKKTKETINYLHEEGKTKLVNVVNLTGTPYINNKMIEGVVYHFGLKQGIERGILKQVKFFEYGNVKTEGFVDDVITKFWERYGENKLEGRLPKIAFYASNIQDLREELRPKIEAVLAKLGISTDKILEYHTDAEENREDFLQIDTEESKKQFILLVGKGTEGWNCRSLVSCALFRKPTSSIFVLQSSTRCLRSIDDNSTVASIYLSQDNYKILDKELKNNFATTIEDISSQKQVSPEYKLTVEKVKRVKVNKVTKEIVSISNTDIADYKIKLDQFNNEKYLPYLSESQIFLDDEKRAKFEKSHIKHDVKYDLELTYYEIVALINRSTKLACLDIDSILSNNFGSKKEIEQKINTKPGLLPFIVESILKNAFRYEEKITQSVEELELTKKYPFSISVSENRKGLVVFKNDQKEGRLGFHINPYNFDSADEKSLFLTLRDTLEPDESIRDIYFTGGVTDPIHNDFYFEYFNPKDQRIARYFPDFLIETSKDRYIVVEVKGSDEKLNYEKNKKDYTGKSEDLFNEVFAKELGFQDFQKANKNFVYHIIFDAGLQNQQKELFSTISNIRNSFQPFQIYSKNIYGT